MQAMILTYLVQFIFLKFSLALQFARLVSTTWEKVLIYSAGFVTATIGVVHFFTYLFMCGAPRNYAITLFTQPQKCLSEKTDSSMQYAQVSTSVVFDLIVVGLPLRHILTNRTMDIRTKLSVSAILLLFIGGLVASIVRLTTLEDVYGDRPIQEGSYGGLVILIEGSLFVIGGCLGTLRPLWKKTVGLKSKMNSKGSWSKSSSNKSQESAAWSDSTMASVWNQTPSLPPPDAHVANKQ
jgi:hypothetical protein